MKLKAIVSSLLACFAIASYAQVGVPLDQAKSGGVAVKPDPALSATQPVDPAKLKVQAQPYMPTTSHRIIEPPKGAAPSKPAPLVMKKVITTAADEPSVEEESSPARLASSPSDPAAIQKLVASRINSAVAANESQFAAQAAQSVFPGLQGGTGELKNDITVRNGVTEIIKIPKNFLTRMITPFAKPEAKSVNDVEVEVVGSTIYLTPTSDQPIGLFVYDTEDPTSAMTLQLIPQDIPQRDISLRLVGSRPTLAPGGRGGEGRGAASGPGADRGNQPYTSDIVALMVEVARGKVPSGYTLANPIGNEADCNIPGVKSTLGQLVDGQRRKVAVLVLENLTSRPIEVNEQACYRSGVVGVSIWPNPVIDPGQKTEAYILMNHQEPAFDAGSTRPKLVN